MKSVRVTLSLLALLAVPFVAASAQGNSTTCSPDQARAVARARAAGHQVPPGLAKKCPPPPAPVPPPPPAPGIHQVHGIVFEDMDGNGSRDPFAGEMGLMGWSVELLNSLGQVLATASTDDAGNFVFTALPNGSYSACMSMQSGYVQTAPTSGTGCSGLGYSFTIQGTFETWVQNVDFGVMLQ